jgi:hypothetical protein
VSLWVLGEEKAVGFAEVAAVEECRLVAGKAVVGLRGLPWNSCQRLIVAAIVVMIV